MENRKKNNCKIIKLQTYVWPNIYDHWLYLSLSTPKEKLLQYGKLYIVHKQIGFLIGVQYLNSNN